MKRAFETHIRVALPPEQALLLFTPRGEEEWVPGWKPRYIEPAEGDTVAGMVFETGEGAGRTIWTCLEWDTDAGRASYLRVVPDERVTRVHVTCELEGVRGTRVKVRYEHVAITPKGETWLSALTQSRYKADIASWQNLIEAAIEDGRIAAIAA